MLIRERTEQLERDHLSPYAALSCNSRGRRAFEEKCPVRTDYQRDRDRIIHLCRAFRRLAQKTQVFFAPQEDHLRTRLSHTLEVSQVGRTIAKALRLNEELTEAIALGHDVGHTPFGHAGEAALDEVYRQYDAEAGFAHNAHSLRVVDELERNGSGLNLTYETREGITAHSKAMRSLKHSLGEGGGTLEAMVVRISDRIAYLNHDLDDCLRAGVIPPEDVPQECLDVLGRRHSERVGRMVMDVVEHSLDAPALAMSDDVLASADLLKDFLNENVYLGPRLSAERDKIRGIIHQLFHLYMASDEALFEGTGFVPPDVKMRARVVCDYVAGMTDRFARNQYLKHFLPSGFLGVEGF
jgi:dGTPase